MIYRLAVAALLGAGSLAGCALASTSPASTAAGSADCAAIPDGRGSARPIPGFPGLATQRLLADLLEQSADWSDAQWQAWVARSRRLALHDGQAEAGLPLTDACTVASLQRLADPDAQAALRQAAQVPSEYSLWQRILGAYPLTALGLRVGIAGYQAATLRAWGTRTPAPLELWAVDPAAAGSANAAAQALAQAPRDALGAPILSAALSAELARAFAPRFWVQTQTAADVPGAPVVAPLGVDVRRPVLSWRLDTTRAHGQLLTQISWTIWFAERPASGPLDPYAGALDGVIWRTTFGPDGWPLIHDTIHSCGCYHMVFPARHSARAPAPRFWLEQRLQPQAPTPWALVSVVLEAGTHYVIQVAAADSALAEVTPQTLQLEPWAQTRQALEPSIRADGVIRGSERAERYWLWPSGVRSPGAMRDFGRHATAFIGTQHFDDPAVLSPYLDPDLLESIR